MRKSGDDLQRPFLDEHDREAGLGENLGRGAAARAACPTMATSASSVRSSVSARRR